MRTENIIVVKSKLFALRIIKLCQHLTADCREYVLSKQLLRSGTSIGANVKEATRAESKPDFYHKMGIALKEASETEYWLELLHESGYLPESRFTVIYHDCQELLRILMAITKKRNET